MKITIKRGQIWKSKHSDVRVIVTGTSGGKWKAKILTDKPGKYGGSHTLTDQSFRQAWVLQI